MLSKMEDDPLIVPRTLWKRKFWVLPFIILGLIGGWLSYRWLPSRYWASTMILVEPQKVPSEYVKSTVTTSVAERLRTIEQQITNRENLERIILDLDLYTELRQTTPMEEVVARVRDSLFVEVERGATFRVSFTGDDPVEVATAANRVADLFIKENLKVREGQAERTSQFLETELEEIRTQLEEQEAKVASFRLLHEGELPEQKDSNLVAVSRLESELAANRDAVEQAETRLLLLESELRSVSDGGIPVATSDSRLEELRLELAELRSQYTERHPDVARVKRELAELEARAAERTVPEEITRPVVVNPSLASEIATVKREQGRLEVERERILADIGQIEQRLQRTPRVGQELLILTRDYDNLQESYRGLLSKRLEARLSQNLERDQQSEQFRILERAVPPESPYYPNSWYCLGVGLLVGLALGVGTALLREQVDQTFGDPRSLQVAFPGVVVLPSIPTIRSELADSGRATRPGSRSA
jgi:polysaccharide chain length determinant protein (PEP-CTERM system associated)